MSCRIILDKKFIGESFVIDGCHLFTRCIFRDCHFIPVFGDEELTFRFDSCNFDGISGESFRDVRSDINAHNDRICRISEAQRELEW